MSNYTPVYTKPYGDGFVNAPPYETPITAEVMNAYDEALRNIEEYLSENPGGDGDVAAVDASVEDMTLTIQLCDSSGEIISEKAVTLPSSGNSIDLSNGTATVVVYDLTARYNISMGRKSGTATGTQSVAVGRNVTASQYYAHAEGEDTEATGEAAHAEGRSAKASGDYAHAEGLGTEAAKRAAHAEGNGCKATGEYAHAEGMSTNTGGYAAHAEGYNTTASSSYAHAEGQNTNAVGECAHAEGYSTTASGAPASHAEGQNTNATGVCAHAEGYGTTASGNPGSHAEGLGTNAAGSGSHAEGIGTNAAKSGSHAEGLGTNAAGESQHVQGKYNIEDADGKYVHIVGNGESADSRSNVHTLDWHGNAWYSGTVECTGIILTDTADNAKRYLIQVTDGQLAVTEVAEQS